jgi:hypothetical protein
MGKMKLMVLVILPILAAILFGGCENYTESSEINGLIKKNDLSINMIVQGDSNNFIAEKIYENGDDYCLKIDVRDTYSLRGEAAIKPGVKYKLSFTLKNTNADPVINYSFWEKPKTSLRHYTFKGKNGNPPTSETQAIFDEWITHEETFETLEGEDTFLLTLHCREGTFYIREINIEQTQ